MEFHPYGIPWDFRLKAYYDLGSASPGWDIGQRLIARLLILDLMRVGLYLTEAHTFFQAHLPFPSRKQIILITTGTAPSVFRRFPYQQNKKANNAIHRMATRVTPPADSASLRLGRSRATGSHR